MREGIRNSAYHQVFGRLKPQQQKHKVALRRPNPPLSRSVGEGTGGEGQNARILAYTRGGVPMRMTDLPVGSAPAPVALPHFPDRLHAFVWRNWPLVPI